MGEYHRRNRIDSEGFASRERSVRIDISSLVEERWNEVREIGGRRDLVIAGDAFAVQVLSVLLLGAGLGRSEVFENAEAKKTRAAHSPKW